MARTDTEVTDVGTLGPDAATVGSPLPEAPEWTFNAGIFKGIAIGDSRLTLSANARYASEQWGTMNERPNTLVGLEHLLRCGGRLRVRRRQSLLTDRMGREPDFREDLLCVRRPRWIHLDQRLPAE